ncbi:MAG: leucyl/phenylalanyl-tRNA--protein transferase [Stenotrophobium sp.]
MDNPIRLHWLDPRDPDQPFPPAHLAMRDPSGLLAIGGDLTPRRLLRAYAQGIFPWYNPDEPILWWCPDPRAILPPQQLHVTRSLRQAIRRDDYAMTLDHAFTEVIEACAGERRGSRGTWLGPEMKAAYQQLHTLGHCHSVELWRDGRLAGGLYGVSIGGVFYGESMFSHADNASKIALYWLCEQLKKWQFDLIDCQINSAHLQSLGAQEIRRDIFLQRTAAAVRQTAPAGPWQFDIATPHGAAHLPQACVTR